MEVPYGVWSHYGFSRSPYSTTALAIKATDEQLLVGRDDELKQVLRYLASGVQVIALEGDYGVGKTSLAAVATSIASRPGRSGDARFLASTKPLELVDGESPEQFEKRAYYQVAAAIIANRTTLPSAKQLPNLEQFERWLNTPEAMSWSAGIGLDLFGFGGSLSGSKSRSANTSSGFSDEGVVTLIDSWLELMFPNVEDGGVILLLDNLEVLAKAPGTVHLFESLRDRLFKRTGLRWIIGGAEGTVRTALSTAKMSGTFPDPIDLAPLDASTVPEVIRRRSNALSVRTNAVLPVSPEGFEAAYLATGKGLRVALGLAERFTLNTKPERVLWMDPKDRDQEFVNYRNSEGKKVVDQLSRKLTRPQWKVLTTLVREKDGTSSPSDFAEFDYNTMPGLLAQVGPLKDLGLIEYTVDEHDARRRLMTASENGRLAVAIRK